MRHEHDRRSDNGETGDRKSTPPRIFSPDALRPRARPRIRAGFGQNAEYAHRPGNVFHFLLAGIVVAQRELVSYLLIDSTGYADAAGVGETFEASSDVNAVTVDLLAIHHHVAEVHADAKLHPALGWDTGIF